MKKYIIILILFSQVCFSKENNDRILFGDRVIDISDSIFNGCTGIVVGGYGTKDGEMIQVHLNECPHSNSGIEVTGGIEKFKKLK